MSSQLDMSLWEQIKEFSRSMTFQLLVAPAAFVFLESVINDARIWLGVVPAVVVGWFVLWRLWWRRQTAQITKTDVRSDDPASVLVLAVSAPKDVEHYGQLVRALLDAWNPRHIVCLASTAARKPHGDSSMSGLAVVQQEATSAPGGPLVVVEELDQDDILDPVALEARTTWALRKHRRDRDVVVELTGGTALMSLGLYQAAVNAGVRASYVIRETRVPIIVLDRSEGTSLR